MGPRDKTPETAIAPKISKGPLMPLTEVGGVGLKEKSTYCMDNTKTESVTIRDILELIKALPTKTDTQQLLQLNDHAI